VNKFMDFMIAYFFPIVLTIWIVFLSILLVYILFIMEVFK